MRLFFLVVFDLILLAICVGYGEFPGFVVWLVLSFVGFYANHHLALKQAELLLKVEREHEDDPRQDLLMFAEAALVCMAMEHFVRIVMA